MLGIEPGWAARQELYPLHYLSDPQHTAFFMSISELGNLPRMAALGEPGSVQCQHLKCYGTEGPPNPTWLHYGVLGCPSHPQGVTEVGRWWILTWGSCLTPQLQNGPPLPRSSTSWYPISKVPLWPHLCPQNKKAPEVARKDLLPSAGPSFESRTGPVGREKEAESPGERHFATDPPSLPPRGLRRDCSWDKEDG